MLPVLIYEADQALRSSIVELVRSFPDAPDMRLILASDSADSVKRQFDDMEGVTLIILGLSLRHHSRRKGLDLGHAVMRASHDNYAVYLIHENNDLEAVLMQCDRPAGLLLAPFTRDRVTACLKRVIEDYQALCGDEAGGACLIVSSGAVTYRVPYDQITYIEALDKKLSIYTARQTITLRGALGRLIEDLPDQFVRCHRSYVVNINFVRHTDFADMTLTLSDGDTVPIARSSRADLKARLDAGRGAGA